MKILHFSDLHVWRRVFDFGDPAFKRFLGFANLLVRRGRAFPSALSRRVVDEILRSDADVIVFSGDLTTTALEAEFAAARDLLRPIRDKWGERFFLIPGNHDRYTPRTVRRRLFEESFGYADLPGGSPSGGQGVAASPVRTLAVGDHVAVVGFDASVPRALESTGLFSESLAAALDAELGRQREAGRAVVLVGHFPYAAPAPVRIKHGHRLVGAEQLIGVVARHRPVLYLHGHKHRRWAFRPEATPETLCVNAGSAGLATHDPATRGGFVTIELDDAPCPVAVRAHVAPGDLGGEGDAAVEPWGLSPAVPSQPFAIHSLL